MRRGLAKLAPPPTAASFSSFSGAGGFGRGRGRGTSPSPPPSAPVLGEASSGTSDEDPFVSSSFSSSGIGRGQGRGNGDVPRKSSPSLPSFPSFLSPSQGRGRGGGGVNSPDDSRPDSENPDNATKKPVFFSRYDAKRPDPMRPDPMRPDPTDPMRQVPAREGEDSVPRKPDMTSFVSALGRGKPTPMPGQAKSGPEQGEGKRQFVKREDAAKRAMEVLSRAGPAGGRGRGETTAGGRGRRGRGRGREAADDATYEDDLDEEWNEADEEKFKELLGGEKGVELYDEVFHEAAARALPSPLEDAYQNAVNINNMIEFEPEYVVKFGNPELQEKPPMALEEVFETVKPFMMAYEGFTSQEQWEEAVKDVMDRVPKMKELMDLYAGPDLVTAKDQQWELQRVASTLPANAPTSVKKFTDRVVLSLQSNPGWAFHKKCQFMDKLAWEVNQHYK